MIGKVTIKQVDKSTGEEQVLFQDENQLTEGIKHAIVNVLTGEGSTDLNDYKFSYYQLGNQKYDLSTYDISGDLTSSAFKSYFWTLKNPLTISEYGRDSKWGVSKQNTYMLGSTYPSGLETTKVTDNFVQPPDIKTVQNEFSNLIAVPKAEQGTPFPQSILSSIWITGCADLWMQDPENYGAQPMSGLQDFTVSGPTGFAPSWGFSNTPNRYLSNSVGDPVFDGVCIRPNYSYIYNGPVHSHTQNEKMLVYTKLKKHQTWSGYYAGRHYVSGNDEAYNPDPDAAGARHPLSATVITGRHQIFNRYAQSLIGTQAGQNKVTFMYRYNFDNSAATYSPCAIEVSSGWQNWDVDNNSSVDFSSVYDLTGEGEYGVVSANIYNRYGPLYTYADHLNHYNTFTGTGGAYKDVSAVGFGPSGNFYRVSLSWVSAADKMINYYKGLPTGFEYEGQGVVPFSFPVLSSLSGLSGIPPFGSAGVGMDGKGKVVAHNMPETIPRSRAYYGCVQWDYDASVGPFQNVHAEESYYLSLPQDFVSIPNHNTTRLLDNTTNIRLEVDENLANSQTIREVGLFLKNPSGAAGKDAPFLAAYKLLPCDINKTDQFSYIVDWELSFMDTSVPYTEQSIAEDGCTSS